ncbi:MAG: hypothetical protein NC548_33400 [Lachnospiraceae bacterium]|nr:hypothetical protein [Lachnospiraceae bacterium]
MGKRKISDRQENLNSYYTPKIIKVLSEPTPYESEKGKEKSDISYMEAKGILKYAICQIEKSMIRF